MSTCALCRESGVVLKKSHIYPKFTYRRMKQDENRMFFYSTSRPGPEPQYAQDGIKEELLCESCEQHFSLWEGYFAHTVNQRQLLDLPIPTPPARVAIVPGFDYQKTKLFLMSILWRAAVASTGAFKELNLGTAHEARLREMLLAADPGEPDEYGAILMITFLVDPSTGGAVVRPAASLTPNSMRVAHGIRGVDILVDGLLS